MSVEQHNYEAVRSALFRQLKALGDVLLADPVSPPTIPPEVAIELQHMLVHLQAASSAIPTDYDTRSEQLGYALGHLDRAMLDACKIRIEKEFSTLSLNPTFMRCWVAVRQLERGKHFRDRSPLDPARKPFACNPACDRFYELLKSYSLLRNPEEVTPRVDVFSQEDKWGDYFKEIDRWFQRELLYSSLCGKKSWDALNEMLQSFWTLDVDKLRNLNMRLELDILVTNAAQAMKHGWDGREMKKHSAFVDQYTAESCDGASSGEIRDDDQRWIRRAFTSLLRFYGQNWPD